MKGYDAGGKKVLRKRRDLTRELWDQAQEIRRLRCFLACFLATAPNGVVVLSNGQLERGARRQIEHAPVIDESGVRLRLL